MRWSLLAIVLGASVIPASLTVATESRKTLRIVWLDPHELFGNVERARSEAGAIFRRLGVSVQWEDGTNQTVRGEVRIRVVLMPSEPSRWKLPRDAMGVVLFPDRSRQETVFLFYPAIRRVVGLRSADVSILKPAERRDLGRAIGRVIVHEVVHAVAPSLAHADAGLMHHTLSAGALTRNCVTVDERSKQQFLAGLARIEREGTADDNTLTGLAR